MSRIYSLTMSSALTAQTDLFELVAGADTVIRILEYSVGQYTDVGDAEEEMLVIREIKGIGSITSGSGGATGVIEKLDEGDSASSASAEVYNSTLAVAGSGTLKVIRAMPMNIRAGLVLIFPEETQAVISGGDSWILRLNTTPADSLTIEATVLFEELG